MHVKNVLLSDEFLCNYIGGRGVMHRNPKKPPHDERNLKTTPT